MKKTLAFFKQILGDFFINHFWKNWLVLVFLGLSLLINVALWYLFITKIKINLIPFGFSSAIILLNMILANYLYNREKLASLFLLTIAFLVQIFMLVFIKYLIVVF